MTAPDCATLFDEIPISTTGAGDDAERAVASIASPPLNDFSAMEALLLKFPEQDVIGNATAAAARGLSVAGEVGNAARRWALGSVGGGLWTAGFVQDEESMQKTGMMVVGGFLLAAASAPWLMASIQRNKMIQKFAGMYNHERSAFRAGTKEGARTYHGLQAETRALTNDIRDILEPQVKALTEQQQRTALYVLDQGEAAVGYDLLPARLAADLVAVHRLSSNLMNQAGVLKIHQTMTREIMQQIMPRKTFEVWSGPKSFIAQDTPVSGIKELRFSKIDEIAASIIDPKTGLPLEGLSTNVANVAGVMISQAERAVARGTMKRSFKNLEMIIEQPADKLIPEGWRKIGAIGDLTQIAPDEVAQLFENITKQAGGSSAFVNTADKMKSVWMRWIMFWWWEHGLNAMRIVPAATTNPRGFFRVWDMVKKNDPLLRFYSKSGLEPRHRPDYALQIKNAFDDVLRKSIGDAPVIGKMLPQKGVEFIDAVFNKGLELMERQDRLLWEQIMPTLSLFVMHTQMMKAAKRAAKAGELFHFDSPAFIREARKAATFANNATGRIPQELQNPKLAQLLRLALFSPSWSATRMALTANAAAEASDILIGKLNPLDAMYLPFKMRQLATMVGLTYLGSMLLSGEPPEFNPRNAKFYMKTGLKNEVGRDMGVDLAGWWQDDFKFFSRPFDYVGGRLNPAFKASANFVSGRDYLGRPTTKIQSINNLIKSFGPIPELGEALLRTGQAVTGGPGISGGEALQRTSGILAFGNVATMPRQSDIVIARLSRRLLKQGGVSGSDDRVFELGRLLRSNLFNNQPLIDARVIDYISYRRRLERVREPFVSLWEENKRVMANF